MGTTPESGGRPDTYQGPVERGGIDVFDSLFVRQPIREGHTDDVLASLAEWVRTNESGDVRTLLPVEGVTLASVFLDRGAFDGRDSSGDALLWYVEVPDDDAPAWAAPDETIRERSPLFEEGVGVHLEDEGRVLADGRDGYQLITHATNPHRQARYAEHCGPPLIAPVAGDEVPISIGVAAVPLKGGIASWVVPRVVRLGNWIKRSDRVRRWLRDQTDTLEAEAMYSESLLLGPVDGRVVLHYYMEAEDIERVWEAFHETDNVDTRFSEWAIRRIFAEPETFLELPFESHAELLVHAVHPDRP